MNDTVNIEWTALLSGYVLFTIPLAAFWYFSTGLIRDTVIAIVRMTVQLILVGLYLEFIFQLNNVWVNLLWVLVMIGIAGYTIVRRSDLDYKLYLFPVMLGVAIGMIVVDAYFFGVVLPLESTFEARYFIPLSGMILGNSIRSSIIGLDAYYNRLQREKTLYRYALANGATRSEGLRPFMRDGLRKAFNPAIATMAMVGLISLPGMMTGQILGGTAPALAIKYQIMLMITIFVASVITVLLAVFISNRFLFNGLDDLKGTLSRKA